MEMQNMSTPTGYQEQATTNASASASANTEQSPPVKRRPGRPKGSTKKNLTGEPVTPKIKRPVGRPRKDGFPAGSVAPSRPRPLKQARHSFAGTSSIGYPQQHLGGYIPVIDPHLQSSDDWATLSRTSPNAFLSVLLSALAAPNPISTAGPSVEDAFKSHLGSLQPNTAHQPIPALYAILKTFWLPSSPAYFSLTASASTARTPSEHRFLYWDPQPLVFNGIACPACSAPLINKGRISSGPIKIYDIEKPFFIIGCEYACVSPSCAQAQRTFASTDSSIFRSLPGKLQDEFPARLLCGDVDAGSGSGVWNWGAMGVSWSLWNMVRGCLRLGMGREAILRLVEAVQRGVPEDEEEEQGEGGDNMKIDGEGGGGGVDPSGSGAVGEGGGAGGSGGGEGGGTTNPLGSAQDQTSTLPPTFLQNFLDAYNDAWRANSGASPSTSAAANTVVSGATAATANVTNTTTTANQPANASTSSTPSLSSLTPSTPTTVPPTTVPPTSTISTTSPSMQNTTSSPSTNTTIQQNKPPIPPAAVGVYDYAKTFPAYPYPAYAFFPPASTSVSGSTGGSGSGGLKRGYPFTGTDEAGSGSGGGGGAKSTPPAPPPTTTSSSSAPQPPPPTTSSPTQTPTPATTTKRAPRHCVKCGSQECKGKGGRSFCTNGCQDCGRLECRGRNSRRPDKRCAEGWGGSG